MYQNNVFHGIYKDLFCKYIQMKYAIGYKNLPSFIHNLKRLNEFLLKKDSQNLIITKETFNEYIELREGEAVSTQQKRYTAIHGFASFLIHLKYEHIYDSRNTVYKKENHIPHIYTDTEIEMIFNAADIYRHLKRSGIYDHDKMFPIILRLLYSTGMRISEVLNLKQNDFNKVIGSITILNSKNQVSRQIILSDSMKKIVIKYIESTMFTRIDDYLFHGNDYRKYSYSSVLECFHRILRSINNLGHLETLRLHDFRHTFSVRALEKMEALGYDLYVALPILVKYLGHKSITETEYYLRLTKGNHKKITNATSDLFPKVEVD